MTTHLNRANTFAILLLLVSSAAAGCQPAAPKRQQKTPGQTTAVRESVPPALGSSPARAAAASESGAVAGSMRRRSVGDAKLGSSPTVTLQRAGRAKQTSRRGDTLTIGELLAHPVPSGQRVVVRGACLDQFHARGSAGPPPVTRSDWQLTDGTQVVYVTGRYPSACSTGRIILSAIVQIDTIAAGTNHRARLYLANAP